MHPRGICVEIRRRVRGALAPCGGRLTPVFTLKPFQVVFRLRSGAGSIPCRCRTAQWCCGQYLCPRLDRAPWMRRLPRSRFSSAIRTSSASTSLAMGGLPGPRWAARSYFLAISFRCQINSVSGVTMVATSAGSFRPSLWTWRLLLIRLFQQTAIAWVNRRPRVSCCKP